MQNSQHGASQLGSNENEDLLVSCSKEFELVDVRYFSKYRDLKRKRTRENKNRLGF